MQLKVKRLFDDSILPSRYNPSDAGLDLIAHHDYVIDSFDVSKIPTGIAIELPESTVGLILDRSSLGARGIKVYGGVIDSSYRGQIFVCLGNMRGENYPYTVKRGEKIAQLVIVPILLPEVYEVNELTNTLRNNKGFGSSGR